MKMENMGKKQQLEMFKRLSPQYIETMETIVKIAVTTDDKVKTADRIADGWSVTSFEFEKGNVEIYAIKHYKDMDFETLTVIVPENLLISDNLHEDFITHLEERDGEI